MAKKKATKDVAAIFEPDTIAAINAAWEQLLTRQGIPAEHAAFSIVARRDILDALGWTGKGKAPTPGAAVVAGFFYRDHDRDGNYTPGEELTATLLGLPELQGPDVPAIEAHVNCFWSGPLKSGEKFTLTYDVDGVERVSQTLTAEAGLNLAHVRVTPTKPLTYINTHSHFDPEWRDAYEGYLKLELPQLIERIELLREQRDHCFTMDEECAVRPLVERYPEILEEFRQRVIEGAIEIKGVITAGELNMPLGESMIRQMTDGDQLISSLLGMTIRPTIFWNIDNYGINFQLPQILAKAGRKYLLMGEYNHHGGAYVVPTELPFSDLEAWNHSEFWLEGLDGSKVLLHRSVYGTQPYGPQIPLERLRSHQSAFNFEGGDFSPANQALPDLIRTLNDREAAEKLTSQGPRRNRGWTTTEPGRCKYILATSEQFFRAVEVADDLPTIKTESRLGLWTGCYESRVRGRQLNRRIECLLMAAESISSAARLVGMDDVFDELRQAWYLLLINHHHDPQLTVMGPGLYDKVMERYVESDALTQKTLTKTLAFLTDRIASDAQPGQPVVVFNSLAWPRSAVVEAALPSPASTVRVVDAAGEPVPAQTITDQDGKATGAAFAVNHVPPAGWRTYYLQAGESAGTESPLTASEQHLENEHVRVELDDGLVQKIIEKSTGRCLFAAGEAAAINEVFIWEDEGCIAQIRPVDFMASAKLVCRSSGARRRTRLAEAGPARAAVETAFEMDWGQFTQTVVLEAGGRSVDFRTHVDWHPAPPVQGDGGVGGANSKADLRSGSGRRVRVAFPSTFKNAKVWRDIPFAVLPWEQSDVIQPMNTWLGLSDADDRIGAALVHDGPCSQQVLDDCLWQTLFRSVWMPGKVEDNRSDPPCGWDLSGDTALVEGENTYCYRLYPYAGDWRSAAVPRVSLDFNTPMIPQSTDAHSGELPGEQSHLALEPKDLISCVWKRADNSNATIVRAYNPTGDTITGTLHLGFPVASAEETDFREEHVSDLDPHDGRIDLEFSPYEIKTIRLVGSAGQ